MPKGDVYRALDVKAELGESPVWSVEEQALYWVDIHRRTVNRFEPGSGATAAWSIPSLPGCVVLREGGGGIVAARDGFYEIDFKGGVPKRLLESPYNLEIFRFNDGRTDRQGRFCVGSMANLAIEGQDFRKSPYHGTGVLYRYDGVSLMPIFAPLAASNGTAFSPDGRTLYRADTRGRIIYAHDYDPVSGTASNERIFARTPDALGLPDGACVDADGGYWSALPAGPDGGSVARFTPDGELDFHIETPIPVPTMAAFGGPEMSTLYITSARIERYMGVPVHPLSGDIFAVETEFRGCPETPCVLRG